jgi:hypothetical protein
MESGHRDYPVLYFRYSAQEDGSRLWLHLPKGQQRIEEESFSGLTIHARVYDIDLERSRLLSKDLCLSLIARATRSQTS